MSEANDRPASPDTADAASGNGPLPPEPCTLRLVLFNDIDDDETSAVAEWRITGGHDVQAKLLNAVNHTVAELEMQYAGLLLLDAVGTLEERYSAALRAVKRLTRPQGAKHAPA